MMGTFVSASVLVQGLVSGDIVKIYNSASGSTILGSRTVTSGSSVNITLGGIYTSPGTVYVTVTSVGKTESNRTAK